MTDETREAITELGAKLRDCEWRLDGHAIRHTAIQATETYPRLDLSPLGMAVARMDADRISELLANPEHAGFRREVKAARRDIRDHLLEAAPAAGGQLPGAPWLDREALRYAAAWLVDEQPARAESSQLLGLDTATIRAIRNGADAADGEIGRALAAALGSNSNELPAEAGLPTRRTGAFARQAISRQHPPEPGERACEHCGKRRADHKLFTMFMACGQGDATKNTSYLCGECAAEGVRWLERIGFKVATAIDGSGWDALVERLPEAGTETHESGGQRRA